MENYKLQQCPKTWLLESILATILCCLPLGIAGIVYASKVESAYNLGDYQGAKSASENAKKFTMIAAICGVVAFIIPIIIIIIIRFVPRILYLW